MPPLSPPPQHKGWGIKEQVPNLIVFIFEVLYRKIFQAIFFLSRAREADINVIMLNVLHLQTSSLANMDHPTHQIQTFLQDFNLNMEGEGGDGNVDSDGKTEHIIVLNKSDLVPEHVESLEQMCKGGIAHGGDPAAELMMPCCVMSCTTGAGLDKFLEVLRDKVTEM